MSSKAARHEALTTSRVKAPAHWPFPTYLGTAIKTPRPATKAQQLRRVEDAKW